MQGTWQKEAEEPLPSAKKIEFIPRYFKTDTDSEVILILSNFLKLTDPCAYDVKIVNSENADELALYWNRTAILLKVNAAKKLQYPWATQTPHRIPTLLRLLILQ
jgi:hypothetical protein